MRATSKHLQIQGRSAKHIFILQMPRNIVSLFKRFGRPVFQIRTSSSCKTLCLIVKSDKQKNMNSLKRPWTNLILAPIWFLIIIVSGSIYFGVKGVSENDIPNKISENTPTVILIVQVLLLFTLLFTIKNKEYLDELIYAVRRENWQK